MPEATRLDDHVIVVTGGSRGIGAAVAVVLAGLGAQLVLIARTRGALEETDDAVRAAGGRPATLIVLDLADQEKLDPLGPALFDRYGRVDGLVANAGELGVLTAVRDLDPKVFARAMIVNALANQRLVRSLEPLLRAASAGRAVFTTCEAARAGWAYWGAYAASKAAMNEIALAWAAETRKGNLRVNLFDPGPVATKLRAEAFPGERGHGLRKPEDVAGGFVELLLPSCSRHGEIVRFDAPDAQSGS